MTREMNSETELKQLKADYQAVAAPPYLAARIRAGLPPQSPAVSGRRLAIPGFALALVCLIWLWPQDRQPAVVSVKPKFPTLAGTPLPLTPRLVFPSYSSMALGQLNTSRLKMPTRPMTGAALDEKPGGRS